MSAARRVLLVGAGHAHLHVAAKAQQLRRAGIHTTLIAPEIFWYSGRATGMLGGQCRAEDDQIDARRVIERAGGEFIAGEVTRIDRARQQIHLADESVHDYDWLSLNVGSRVPTESIAGCAEDPNCWPVKPIARLDRLKQALKTAFAADRSPSLAVIGGGATGCEIAANLAGLARREIPDGARPTIHLLQAGPTLAPALPDGAQHRLANHLQRLGVTLLFDARVAQRRAGTLMLENGDAIDAEHVIVASGLVAPAWLAELGLEFDDGLVVDETLRSPDDARIFAVGDCARIAGRSLPRLGVFGVRQAPILLANLIAAAGDEPMQRYQPQSKWLSILDLGDGTALATRGKHWWHGRTSLWLKHWLDRRFIESYRR